MDQQEYPYWLREMLIDLDGLADVWSKGVKKHGQDNPCFAGALALCSDQLRGVLLRARELAIAEEIGART